MDKFAASLMAVANGDEVPEDGYHGGYVVDLAAEVVAAVPGILELPAGEQLVAFREKGYELQLAHQKADLATFRTVFDAWFSERSLHDDKLVDAGEGDETVGLQRVEAHRHPVEAGLLQRRRLVGEQDAELVGCLQITYIPGLGRHGAERHRYGIRRQRPQPQHLPFGQEPDVPDVLETLGDHGDLQLRRAGARLTNDHGAARPLVIHNPPRRGRLGAFFVTG